MGLALELMLAGSFYFDKSHLNQWQLPAKISLNSLI